VDGYARAGFRSELQVRYHPPDGHARDMAGWLAYVRDAVRTFAPRWPVVGLSITNEANLPRSPNTSDGFYSGGLLFDDYREKQAFGVYRDAIARTGAAPPAAPHPVSPCACGRVGWSAGTACCCACA
jgi:hypothetical protein